MTCDATMMGQRWKGPGAMFAKIRFLRTYFLEANPLVSKHLCGGVQRQCPVTPV